MTTLIRTIIILGCLVYISSSKPLQRTKRYTVPFWHLPCGEVIRPEPSDVSDEEIKSRLESIKLQHQLTLNDYLNRDYGFLYERVRIGVHHHQYIPNWIPGKEEVNSVRALRGESMQLIVSYLPQFHIDLQKFAVAIEELLNDQTTLKIREALRATRSYLQMMLCELESNIAVFPDIALEVRVNRNIMSPVERDPVDETRRLVRDWGVLLKYRNYLHAWRYVFDY
ncbi:uncharacterized protein [Chelonus insularis]|uniref:uncharacterized protein n=1 Tax=Chelonus insularis TaxID=460826 RepID=UPI00158965C9|nr:uncharacterized protein LOC118071502 [Chelonus insularis]